jgi:hypothetical protein
VFSHERLLINRFSVTNKSSSQFVKPLSRELKKAMKVITAIREVEITI